MDVEKIAKGLSREDKACLLDLAARNKPWLMGPPLGDEWAWADATSRRKFYNLGLIEAVFPEAAPGDSGRQFWVFSKDGLAVREYLEKSDEG